ncbi:DEAD/DEAH box helicase [Labrenzia sp. VG12]|uniref:DEAD/DEAH box helicase n=1 Tax=Labrenzia sp. VG12 TaxID=2021862 RepID=UPI000B8C30A7|nr:DEAD/DEAH box helicase family protein [Labrenzia sp. VG12]ASP35468.1 DEAD/DEAH box helicase [Labrenzia sp. VG12]
MIPHWFGEISVPELPERRAKVGGNTVFQRVFLGATTKAKMYSAEFPGHELIEAELNAPFNNFLMRKKGARRVNTDLPVLISTEEIDLKNLPRTLSLEWDSFGILERYANTPDEVIASWDGHFSFRTENEEKKLPGLRAPQIGALHAISAHFSVGNEHEAATVVLPTGTGKTETMLATQVYRQLKRTLVIVPSDALRSQISKKFISLGVLSQAGVIPHELARPKVAVVSTGIRSVDEAKELVSQANVIVALPNSLESSNPNAVVELASSCSDLMVDEAHHITASTWQKVRKHFEKKRILQFTATPFRRDSKRIDGKIIFNYRLGDAQDAGYYRPINLVTIEEYGEQSIRDEAIAKEAIRALRRDRDERKLDHLLMARTRTKERAEEIFSIYQRLAADLKPVLVYSGPGRIKANSEALSKLLDRTDGGTRIVVCVDMLGEGFDLPNLKIAALHDTHKSLAVTLQFVGRFTRKGNESEIGEATVVTNIADQKAETKLADLYAEGADWDRLIKRLSEDRIEKELRLQDIVFALKETGDLHENLSLWNLRPALSGQFFRTTCSSWTPLAYQSVLPNGAETWHALSDKEHVLVAVVCRVADVNWGNYQNVANTIYDLLIVRWDKKLNYLALYASDYNALRSERMAQAITGDKAQLVSGTPIFKILNNVELPLVKSLGSSRMGAISFTSYFGPNVTEGLASIEKAESELNNIACLGYENGDRVLWGGTQRRGKIWQQKSGTVSDWIAWTSSTWSKVTAEIGTGTNIVDDFLSPIKMSKPHTSWPISVQWGEQAQIRFNDHQFVRFDGKEVPLFNIDLELGEYEEGGPIIVRIASDFGVSEYALNIDENLPGGYRHDHLSGPVCRFRKGRDEAILMEEYLQKDPFIIRYADGTFSYNCYHIPLKLDAGLFEREKLETWDWNGIPLNKESMHKVGDKATIQFRTFKNLETDFDVIFNDDGSGEVADLVCLKDVDESTIQLCLVHCKGAYKGRVSQDIRNFYTVCGQAQKSITAKHAGLPTLYHDLKRRQETWAREGYTRFLKGDMKQLAYFKEKARRAKIEFEMILVQPGASAQTITEDALKLLATTELYLFKTTTAKFRVVVSE